MIDDTISEPLGASVVGAYRGPPEQAIAPVTVQLLPAVALALARARRAAVRVDSATIAVRSEDLRAFQSFYRVAICGTVPRR